MKIAVIIASFLCLALYIAGLTFYLQGNEAYQEKAIGYGTLVLFFVVMPLFLYWRYSKKYLNQENEEIE